MFNDEESDRVQDEYLKQLQVALVIRKLLFHHSVHSQLIKYTLIFAFFCHFSISYFIFEFGPKCSYISYIQRNSVITNSVDNEHLDIKNIFLSKIGYFSAQNNLLITNPCYNEKNGRSQAVCNNRVYCIIIFSVIL